MSIEAIVSDVGGVIVRDDFPSFFARFEARIGASAEAFYALTVGSEEWRLYNKGFITEEELWGKLGPKLRVEDEVARELKGWRRMLVPIPETVGLLRRVRERYPLYCLSNVDKETTQYLQERYHLYDLFDGTVLSWEAGMRKPEVGIYELVIHRFNLPAERTIYIDDKEPHLIPARHVGFQTLPYRSPQDLEVELLAHGVELSEPKRRRKREESDGVQPDARWEVSTMKEEWEERILCATECSRCRSSLDRRILSVYDHQVICMECKKSEEERPDYDEVSKKMIRQCLVDTEQQYGDPGGFCYHHFYPYTC